MDIDDTSFAPRTKIGDTIKLLQKFYNLFFLFKSQLNFVKHNKTVFTFKTKKTDNIILLEQGEAASNIIAYSYLASTLQDIHDAKIVTYFPRVPRDPLRKFMWWFKSKNTYYTNKLFTSFLLSMHGNEKAEPIAPAPTIIIFFIIYYYFISIFSILLVK